MPMTPAPAIITCFLGGGCESFEVDMASLIKDLLDDDNSLVVVSGSGVVKAVVGVIEDIQTKSRDEKTVVNNRGLCSIF